MRVIDCPSCRESMGIDEHESNTEWECPSCSAAFLVHKKSDGSLQYQITSAPTQTELAQTTRSGTRQRMDLSDTCEGEPDLNISRQPVLPFHDRFPDMRPAPTPSLVTVNGIGTTMYGSRDYDAATGTYVTSECVVILAVPVFVLGSYRVADGPAEGWFGKRGWRVLGRVPLSPLAKVFNCFVLLMISGLLLTCIYR